MNELTDEKLAEIEAEWAATTPGKWELFARSGVVAIEKDGDSPIVSWNGFDDSDRPVKQHENNARFMAHSHDNIPLLIAEVKRLRARGET